MLILTRKRGESFLINDDIELVISDISGDQVKIGIKAPASYKILRKELVQTIETNRLATKGPSAVQMHSLMEQLKRSRPEGSGDKE